MASGGKRDGAGRPTMNPALKRRRIDLHVAPETAERIKLLRQSGVNIGHELDSLVESLSVQHNLI